jgi:hypothetical protein
MAIKNEPGSTLILVPISESYGTLQQPLMAVRRTMETHDESAEQDMGHRAGSFVKSNFLENEHDTCLLSRNHRGTMQSHIQNLEID